MGGDRRQLRALLPGPFAVAVFCFVLWCLAHWVALPLLITYDGHEYLQLGELFGSDRFRQEWNPLRTPGFPLALQISLWLLGRNALAAQVVPLVFGAVGCVLIADSVRRVAGAWAAATALAVLGFYPTLVAFEHMILTETGTFFFLALIVRLGVVVPRTVRAAWMRALAFGLTLSAAYYWRQTVLAALPLPVALQAVSSWRLVAGRKRALLAALQAALVLALPLAARYPWTSCFPPTSFNATFLLDFALRQVVIPPEEPALASIAERYRAAIAEAEKAGSPEGIPWLVVSQLGLRVTLPPMAGDATRYVGRLIARYPGRYAAGVARTLRLFAGFDGGAGESKMMRGWTLAPTTDRTLFAHIPDLVPPGDREDFARQNPPGKLQSVLRRLSGPYDRLLVACNLLTVGLFLTALLLRDQARLALSGVPVIFALSHAVALMSVDRFVMPVY